MLVKICNEVPERLMESSQLFLLLFAEFGTFYVGIVFSIFFSGLRPPFVITIPTKLTCFDPKSHFLIIS